MSPAVFMDRDGTLMEEAGYCADPAQVRVFPGVAEALQSLRAAGYLLIVVTNQSGIGRGYFREHDYLAVDAELQRQILPARFDATYFCADEPSTPSPRRKPAPGMLLEAARDYEIDLANSYMVGDKATDMECGRAVGCSTILVRTGYGQAQINFSADIVCETFSEAAAHITGETSAHPRSFL